MASVSSFLLNSASSAVVNVGRSLIHAALPDDYEYYACTLELLDSTGRTAAYMVLPVMPSNITETTTALTTVTKANNLNIAMVNPSFTPVDITLLGTFGRKLRVSFGQKPFNDTSEAGKSIPYFNVGQFTSAAADGKTLTAKTGYGLTKMLQKILTASSKLDPQGKPYRLVFTNHAFNTAYYVEVLQESYAMDERTNAVWYYNLTLRAMSAYKTIASTSNFVKQAALISASRTVSEVVGGVADLITCGVMNF